MYRRETSNTLLNSFQIQRLIVNRDKPYKVKKIIIAILSETKNSIVSYVPDRTDALPVQCPE